MPNAFSTGSRRLKECLLHEALPPGALWSPSPFPSTQHGDHGEQIPHSSCSEASHCTAGVQLPSCCQLSRTLATTAGALKHEPGRFRAADDPGACHRPNRCDGKSQGWPHTQQKYPGMESDLCKAACVFPRESSPPLTAHFLGGIRRRAQCSP